MRGLSGAAALIVLAWSGCWAQGRPAPAVPAATIDPAAARTLEAMARAYRDLRFLEQDTTYTGSEGAPGGMVRSHLIVRKPNRLLLELYQRQFGRAEPWLSRFQCDGKNFYSYREQQGYYKKEAAPRSLKEYDVLAVSVELAAITGGDPLPALSRNARSIRMEAPATADGVPVQVILIDAGSADSENEVRLFIGESDHLLRRFTCSVQPRSSADQKPADNNPYAEPVRPLRYAYDNHIRTGAEVTKDPFTWVAPTGAFEYSRYPKAPDTRGGFQIPGAPPGTQPIKIVPLQELIKHPNRLNELNDQINRDKQKAAKKK